MRASVAMLIAAGVTTLACGSQQAPAAPSSATPATPARTDLSGTWSGSGTDSCEGLFANGQLALTKQQ